MKRPGIPAISQPALFEAIFSDGHVVDVDLSAWDKCIVLYVLADHAGRTAAGHKRLFAVDFNRVRALDIRFNHLGHDPPIKLGPDEHVQWRIDDFEIEPREGALRIQLWGFSSSPRMAIECDSVNVREMPADYVSIFPRTAFGPSAGFLRPGLDNFLELLRRWRSSR